MRLDYLQKILGHVRSGLTCPCCQEVFGNSDVKIVSINERTIDIAINCPHCQTNARVSAQVTTQKSVVPVMPQKEVAPEISTQAHITPEALEGLRDQITHLSSSDIEHLGTD